jgi:hypothetical protein
MTAHGSARSRLASLDERHGRACFLKARHGRALSRTSRRRESRLKSRWPPGRRRLRARVQRAVRSSSSDVQRAVGRSTARLLFLLPWRVPEAPNDTDRRRPVQARSATALEGSLKPHGRLPAAAWFKVGAEGSRDLFERHGDAAWMAMARLLAASPPASAAP